MSTSTRNCIRVLGAGGHEKKTQPDVPRGQKRRFRSACPHISQDFCCACESYTISGTLLARRLRRVLTRCQPAACAKRLLWRNLHRLTTKLGEIYGLGQWRAGRGCAGKNPARRSPAGSTIPEHGIPGDKQWWAILDSNQWPLPCEDSALTS